MIRGSIEMIRLRAVQQVLAALWLVLAIGGCKPEFSVLDDARFPRGAIGETCRSNDECKKSLKCDTDIQRCVECLRASDCDDGLSCDEGECVRPSGGNDDDDDDDDDSVACPIGASCGEAECGKDPVCGVLECGDCLANEDCVEGQCRCRPQCEGRSCGDDGCGGSCGGCDDSNECTVDTCVNGACNYDPEPRNGGGCTDGEFCTQNDTCQAGTCVPGGPRDCTDADGLCIVGVCDEENDECVPERAPDETSCDDGNPCTINDACDGGACEGVANPCDDGNVCTVDSCIDTLGCVNDAAAVNTPCNDENPCTINDRCDGAKLCSLSDPLDCSSRTGPCSVGRCDIAAGGCVADAINEGLACEDNAFCTKSTFCTTGACLGQQTCDDGLTCTDDSCNEGADTCANVIQPTSCLVAGVCYAEGALNPSNPCQRCIPSVSKTAFSNVPDGEAKSCDDNKVCTTNDRCQAGSCRGDAVVCDPSLTTQCTTGRCVEPGGCFADPAPKNNLTCNDGLFCNTGERCNAGVCTGGSPNCVDGKSCTDDICDEDADSCSNPIDASFCLISGTCYADGAVNPSNTCQQCTAVTSQTQFTNVPNTPPKACNDGKACTQTDTCVNGTCTGSNPVVCNDSISCTTDACTEPGGTCSFTVQSGNCLIGGVCITNGTVNPSNTCQRCISTTSTTSYSNVPNSESKACNDSKACTSPDVCTNGACVGPVNCGDFGACDAGNQCIENAGDIPFFDGFESGSTLQPYWQTITSSASVAVVTSDAPATGSRHLRFVGTTTSNGLGRARLNGNFAGSTNVVLEFKAKVGTSEGDNAMPATFTGTSNTDGVALSLDGGTNWIRIHQFSTSGGTGYLTFRYNLTDIAASQGQALNDNTRIQFQVYASSFSGNNTFIDDVTITECTPSCGGKACGDDGCGATCGTCTAPLTCNPGGQCN